MCHVEGGAGRGMGRLQDGGLTGDPDDGASWVYSHGRRGRGRRRTRHSTPTSSTTRPVFLTLGRTPASSSGRSTLSLGPLTCMDPSGDPCRRSRVPPGVPSGPVPSRDPSIVSRPDVCVSPRDSVTDREGGRDVRDGMHRDE